MVVELRVNLELPLSKIDQPLKATLLFLASTPIPKFVFGLNLTFTLSRFTLHALRCPRSLVN